MLFRSTDEGTSNAKRLIIAHSLWEVFLINKLNMNWADVHLEAENLEHAVSPKVIKLLDKYLEHPKYSPYGRRIPTFKEYKFNHEFLPLFNIKVLDTFIIKKVYDNPDLLHFLNRHDLKLGSSLVVMYKNNFTQIIQVSYNECVIDINYHISKMIYGITVESTFKLKNEK